MRSFLAAELGLLVLILATHAVAEEGAQRLRPLELGLSSGYSSVGLRHPGSLDFNSLWAIPLLLDIDYRVSKRWSAGMYGELGFIHNSAPDVEDVDQTLQGHHYRVGLEAIYHSAPERKVQPWFGIGLGFDALRATYRSRSTLPPFGSDLPDPGSSSPVRATGFEVGHAQLGIDFAFVPAFAFGPFVGGSVVAYGRRRGVESSEGFNVWSNLGLKATLRL
ncbi:MAG: hypothetical protein ABW061_11100 [Polyangiaceae bacterium]